MSISLASMSFSRSIRRNSAGCSTAAPMSFAAWDLIYLQYFLPFLSAQSRSSSAKPTAAPGLYLVLIPVISFMWITIFWNFGEIANKRLACEDGSVISSKPSQSRNASAPICVTFSRIVILDSPLHPANAESPILVRLLGTMYANSEDFQVLAITTMVSSFVAEWNDPNMKLHHEWKVMPSRPLSMRSEQSNSKARGQLLKSKLNISERAAPVNFGSMKSAARFSLL